LPVPEGLERIYGQGHLHFITFSCYQRLPLLDAAPTRDFFVKELGRLRDELGFRLVGYVVMPEHVHLLLSEPPLGNPSTVLHTLKLRVSRKIRARGNGIVLPFARRREPLPAFWQARFYDFNVYSEWKRKEKLEYIHANPVARGLVTHPEDWPWSSWSFYERDGVGLISVDVE
jgi:putative transposase